MRNLILLFAILVSGVVSAQAFDFDCVNELPTIDHSGIPSNVQLPIADGTVYDVLFSDADNAGCDATFSLEDGVLVWNCPDGTEATLYQSIRARWYSHNGSLIQEDAPHSYIPVASDGLVQIVAQHVMFAHSVQYEIVVTDGNSVVTETKSIIFSGVAGDITGDIYNPNGLVDLFSGYYGVNYIFSGLFEDEAITPLTYQWAVNNQDGNGYTDIADATAAAITVSNIDRSIVQQIYRIRVSNEDGSLEKFAVINWGEVPPPPFELASTQGDLSISSGSILTVDITWANASTSVSAYLYPKDASLSTHSTTFLPGAGTGSVSTSRALTAENSGTWILRVRHGNVDDITQEFELTITE